VKDAGGQLGYGQYADAITRTSSGDYTVSDPSMYRWIMKLRDDPAAASAMAGVLTQSNSFQLTGKIGRRPTDPELYMAHFMGVGGAAKLINSAVDDPQASAPKMFPNAAAANRPIFYDRQGNARSVAEVYSELTTRYAVAAGSSTAQTALAMYGASPPGTQVASAAPAASPVQAAAGVDTATYLSQFPYMRTATPVAAPSNAGSNSSPTDPIFRSLFQVDGQPQAVSSTVHDLWGKSSSLTADATPPAANNGAPRPLDLFSDRDGKFSS
jgi:hypothetical protein